jgi:hypothetical protein
MLNSIAHLFLRGLNYAAINTDSSNIPSLPLIDPFIRYCLILIAPRHYPPDHLD